MIPFVGPYYFRQLNKMTVTIVDSCSIFWKNDSVAGLHLHSAKYILLIGFGKIREISKV